MKETILITSNTYLPNIGGIENSLKYLAESYARLGYDVIILVSDLSSLGDKLNKVEHLNNITIYRYPTFSNMKGILKPLRFFRSNYSAYKIFRSIKNHNKIVLTLSRFHITTVIAKLAQMPYLTYLVPGVVKNQNTRVNIANTFGLKRLTSDLSTVVHHLIQKFALKHCDTVLVFSQNMAKQIANICPKRSNVPILKPGVDIEQFKPALDKMSLRIEHKIPTNKIILLTVGRFVRAKGFDLVIDAMTRLPECHLLMVGDGENATEIKDQINQQNLTSHITLVGAKNNTIPYYQLSDIFIMSSRYEPLGQTIIEALATGLPIIAFKGNGILTATEELLSDKEAIFTSKINGDGIANCVSTLTHNPSLMAELAVSGREIAKANFSWSELATQILEYRVDAPPYSP